MHYQQYFIIGLTILLVASCNSDVKHRDIVYPDGGYDYPQKIIDSNFSYPLRDLRSRKDSFRFTYFANYWAKAYQECNLSLRPKGEDIFRLEYSSAFGNEAIITLTENEIIVKQPKKGLSYPDIDTMKLTPKERYYYRILKWNFPINEEKQNPEWKKRLDSIVKTYPKLLDVNYYKYLLDKSTVSTPTSFKYTTTTIPISKGMFYRLVDSINASGYWQMPFHISCEVDVADGMGFILEANTLKKYHYVERSSCHRSAEGFFKICYQIIDATNMREKILGKEFSPD